jgi:hypothetical protein
MKPDIYVIATEPIATAYFINSPLQSVCRYVYSYHCKGTVRLSVFLLLVLGNGSVKTFPGQTSVLLREKRSRFEYGCSNEKGH